MITWYSSDLHLWHTRIIELCGRPFRDVQEMNWRIITNFQRTVGSADRLILLGDVALGPIDQSLPLIGHLPGYKILVPGNHDRVSSAPSMDKYRERFLPEYKKVFDEIWPEVSYSHVNNKPVILSHYPYTGDSHSEVDRYQELRPTDEGEFLICGHVHEKWRMKDKMLNVGVDVNNFRPVSEFEIEAWMSSYE